MAVRRHTNWIWMEKMSAEDTQEPILVLFRKKIELSGEAKKAVVQISADSRYKLFVNGQMAEMGPSRGDLQIWYKDTVDICTYLKNGENVLAVQVLRYPTIRDKGNHGIFRTETPGLYVKGEVCDERGHLYRVDANETWKVRKDRYFHIVSESDVFAPLQIFEQTGGDDELKGWMYDDYNDESWEQAYEYPSMSLAVSPGNLEERTIPFLYRKKQRFCDVSRVECSLYEAGEWKEFLQGKREMYIPEHTKEIVEITAGDERTGYQHLSFLRGAGTAVSILQSEAYVQEIGADGLTVKGNRVDWENGCLCGFTDRYRVAGFGDESVPEEYEPFWFRTFRFIRLKIETEEEPLVLKRFDYTQTGYPLEVKTRVETSDENLKPIWEMSERTLKCCMHETYEDCPFYEQLQYVMDSRSEILYSYSVSADDRLARKCMDDFRRSQRYDGLLNGSYPCYRSNVIPGFSIYYIGMLYDHMMYFGDQDLLEDHMPTIERILRYFETHRTKEGYVEKIGGLNGKDRFWSFIDWTKEWDETTGVPAATLEGAITMESLLYIMGLQYAEKIAEYLGRKEQAQIYRLCADQVREAVRKYCMDPEKMIMDGPGIRQYSQHAQVFGILTDTIDLETGRKNLQRTLNEKQSYAQCSVAMTLYLFRAMEKTGLYERTKEYWKIWTRMLEKGATTCIEDEVRERSECHAWGALILYELPSVTLGVRPAKPGYEAVCLHPVPGYLDSAEGEVITPKGMIKVKWQREKQTGELKVEYEAPEGLTVV